MEAQMDAQMQSQMRLQMHPQNHPQGHPQMSPQMHPQSQPQGTACTDSVQRPCTDSVQRACTDSVQRICTDSVFTNLVAPICLVRIPYKAPTQKIDTSLLFAHFWSPRMYGIRTRQFGP